MLGSACTARVEAPVLPPETEVERVWLLKYHYHSGLAMRDGPQQLVIYEYGEWAWYAENRSQWYRVFPVFLWHSQGALARRRLSVDESVDIQRLRRVTYADRVWAIDVAADKVSALRQRLHQRFEDHRSSELYDGFLDTWFVHDPDPYHAFRTCNDVMAQWLRELGCRVRNWYWSTDWEVSGDSERSPPD